MSSQHSEPATVDAVVTGAQEPQLVTVEVEIVDGEPVEIAYGAPALVWMPEPAFMEDSESTDEEGEDGDEAENPEWFNHCCVSDHVGDFKAKLKPMIGFGAVVLRHDLLWQPGQEITYAFLGGTSNQQETVRNGMSEWMRYANIQFKNIPTEQAAKAYVRIAFKPKDGNWSRVGLTAHDFATTEATANFCGINEEVEATNEQKGVVLHEIGHILGLKHEHQSPSLKGLLTWIEDEVKAYFKGKYKWTRKQTNAQVLNPEDSNLLSSYTHLDLKSIMMYPMPKSTNMFGVGKKGITIPENTSLSTYDKAFIGIHYPFFQKNPRSEAWTFKRSLKEVGCGEHEIERLMEFFNKGDWKTIRRMFEGIYYSVRAKKNSEVETQLYD